MWAIAKREPSAILFAGQIAGVLVYLLVQHDGMAKRNLKAAEASQQQFDSYVQSVAKSDPADQISKAKALLADGTITQAEFDQLKQKALS